MWGRGAKETLCVCVCVYLGAYVSSDPVSELDDWVVRSFVRLLQSMDNITCLVVDLRHFYGKGGKA